MITWASDCPCHENRKLDSQCKKPQILDQFCINVKTEKINLTGFRQADYKELQTMSCSNKTPATTAIWMSGQHQENKKRPRLALFTKIPKLWATYLIQFHLNYRNWKVSSNVKHSDFNTNKTMVLSVDKLDFITFYNTGCCICGAFST